MILSMTGFGESKAEANGIHFRVEIRSLNNRYFKASIKLPEVFQRFEADIDRLLRSRMGRGSVSFSLRVRDDSPAAAHGINTAMLSEYVRLLREAGAENGSATIDVARLLDVPGVLQPPEIPEEVLKAQFDVVQRLTQEAIDHLIEMRKREGTALLKDLEGQCEELAGKLEVIRHRSPSVVDEYKKKLEARINQLLGGLNDSNLEMHQDSISREVALFAERCDVNEEVSRIGSHLDQFKALCSAPEQAGRKLDFIAQELLREANTIGSKSNDSEISRCVVDMKAAIDRIKEQVQNVE